MSRKPLKKAASEAGAYDMLLIVIAFSVVIVAFASRVNSDEAAQIIIGAALAFLLAVWRIRHKIKETGDDE